jgi:thiol-disulfide isomerase/thioredoxin
MRLVLAGGVVLVAALLGCRPTAPPSSGFTLLFLGRSPAAFQGGLSWAPDPEHGRLVAFDGELRVTRRITNPRLATPMAVTPLGGAELLVTERTGEGVVVDTSAGGRVVREWESPDVASLYAAGGGRVVATRSPYYVPQLSTPEPDTAPLIRMLDTLGRPIGRGLGTIRRPATPLLDHVVNAGALAVGPDGAVYYAPLVRDEIRKYAPGGQVSWTTKRGLFRGGSEPDPEFLAAKGAELRLKKALVNVALALGPAPPPGGRLYALGSDDSAATRLRVDVLDAATGAILATRHLGPRETAVAVDASGALAVFDADSLVAGADGAAPATRELFTPALALPDLAGDTVTLAGFRGKVTLVNFWASWCDPCREEFPHMAELYHEFDRKDFEIAGVSDDVDSGRRQAFVRQYRPPFPILVGGGRMKQVYHYRGLPYSVLLDRQGRVIERIFGFGGAEEFRRLHATIANEVRVP